LDSFTHSPLPWDKEKIEGRREDLWIDKDSLIGEAKAASASNEKKEFIPYFLLAGRHLAPSWKTGSQHV